jgi:hypothetical protein
MASEIKKGYRIPAPLTTLNSSQEYPVADMEDIAGGYHIVKNTNEMFNIPRLHRRVGMVCYVRDEDQEYRLIINASTDKTTAINWIKITTPGGSGSGGSVDLSNYVTKALFDPVKAKVDGLPDMTTMATKVDVQIAKNGIINYVDNKTANMATMADIPDISPFLTQPQIEDLIDESDNDDDVTQSEIDALFNT